jgi:hypothetical protein
MKKTSRKLMLRKETVRELSAQALTLIIGGLDTDNAYPYSRDKVCLIAAVPQSKDK